MRIRFWGTRGSLPVSLTAADIRGKIIDALLAAAGKNLAGRAQIESFVDNDLPFAVSHTYGGNSPCVQIDIGAKQEYILCDLGTGVRPFGHEIVSANSPTGNTFHVFMSHLHWDHIMGFPLFAPLYVPGNRVVIYGCHAELENALRRQHGAPSFPVDFDRVAAHVEFVTLTPGQRSRIAGLEVTPKLQIHSGDSYGYRFEHAGKSVVYSTDSEHKPDDTRSTQEFVEFFRKADLVIFDAMYSLAEAVSVKEDWGHSSNIIGVELCQLAGVKHLCLYHHEPVFSDAKITAVLQETIRLEEITRSGNALRISGAYDGMEIVI